MRTVFSAVVVALICCVVVWNVDAIPIQYPVKVCSCWFFELFGCLVGFVVLFLYQSLCVSAVVVLLFQ